MVWMRTILLRCIRTPWCVTNCSRFLIKKMRGCTFADWSTTTSSSTSTTIVENGVVISSRITWVSTSRTWGPINQWRAWIKHRSDRKRTKRKSSRSTWRIGRFMSWSSDTKNSEASSKPPTNPRPSQRPPPRLHLTLTPHPSILSTRLKCVGISHTAETKKCATLRIRRAN